MIQHLKTSLNRQINSYVGKLFTSSHQELPKEMIKNNGSIQYLDNCPPTPPLTQQQSTDNNLGLMLG